MPSAAELASVLLSLSPQGLIVGPVSVDKKTERGVSLCPWHEEQTASLALDFKRQRAHCRSCRAEANIEYAAIDNLGTYAILVRTDGRENP